jgi:AbrB family looped-hinge helix DNA binding protein
MENGKIHEKMQEIPEIARVSSKGQIVIPTDIRERLGIKEGSIFAVSSLDGDMVVMKKVESPVKAEDMELLAEVKKAWEEFDRGQYKTYTVKEFMKKLDKMRKAA